MNRRNIPRILRWRCAPAALALCSGLAGCAAPPPAAAPPAIPEIGVANATVVAVRPVRLSAPDAATWRARFLTNHSASFPPEPLVELVVRTDGGRTLDLLRPLQGAPAPGARIHVDQPPGASR